MTKPAPGRVRRGPFRAGLRAGATLVLVLAAWILFAPVQVGGSFSYFRVVGDSMEPNLTAGDMVLMRTDERYEVGDVVAYRDPDLGPVLHRIRDRAGEQFILRGDNRDADDPYRPLEDEIVGRLWKVVPGGGDAMLRIQSPQMSALFGTGIILFGAISLRGKAKRPERRREVRGGSNWSGLLTDRAQVGASLISAAGLAFAGAAILGGVVLTNPAVTMVTRDVAIEHAGTWEYSGVAGSGLYDGDTVRTGDPVFTRLGERVPVTFAYQVSTLTNGRTLESVRGSTRLQIEISQDNGWRRRIPVQEWTPFTGKQATASGVMDLGVLARQADAMEEATALIYPQYRVDLIAEVEVQGDLLGEPFVDLYEARLPFVLGELVLTPAPGFRADPMAAVSLPRSTPGPWTYTLPVVGIEVTYSQVRFAAIGLGIAAVVLLSIVGGATRLAARRGEAALIASRYGAFIVDAASTEVTFAGRRVLVRSIDDLVKMARQDGLFIVHEEVDGEHRYHLVLPDVTYTYLTGQRAVAF